MKKPTASFKKEWVGYLEEFDLLWAGLQGDQAFVFSFQQRCSHEVFVDFSGAFAAFADGPDDEGLSAAHIAGGEDFGDIGDEGFVAGFYVASFVEFYVELFEQAVVLWVDEAHGEEGEFAGELDFAAGYFCEFGGAAVFGHFPFELDGS